MIDFIQFLDEKNLTVLYVGDSLQQQMYHSFLCSVEAEADTLRYNSTHSLLGNAQRRILYSPSYFLTSPPHECRVVRPNFNVSFLQNEDWFHVAMNQEVTHVVINTGAWFIPSGFYIKRDKATRQQTRQCFRKHFQPNSHLYQLLHTLSHRHRIKLIWRDMSPAGVCDTETGHMKENKYTAYYNDFPYYNEVGGGVVQNLLKGRVIPDVYDTSMMYWREHVSEDDAMHWCLFKKYSVPSIWNSKLFQLLQSEYE